MRRICCFTETWASGGIESFLCRVLTSMDRSDLQIDIVTAQIKDSVFTNEIARAGIRILPLSGSKSNWVGNCRRFRALIRQNHYDVIHLNAFQGLQLLYLLIARQEGIPVRIAHSHNTALRRSRGWKLKLLLHRAGRSLFSGAATDFWACSEAAAEFLFKPGLLRQKGFRFIPNGIETGRFRFDPAVREVVRNELGMTGKFVIGCVGRLCQQKNQDFLLDVMAELLPRRPECCLLLVGSGEYESRLKERANALGIGDHVFFHGVTDHVEKLLWAMDAFALPSLFEGLGIVAVEAQAAGLPTFCSTEIPKEACLTPLFHSLPLDAVQWAEALLKSVPRSREDYAKTVAQTGFESSDVAAVMRRAYAHS